MPLEIINAIRSAEITAEQKVAEARREAARTIEDAEREARALVDNVRRDARGAEKQQIERAEADARAALDAQAATHRSQLTELRAQAQANMATAVQTIVTAILERKV